MLTGGVKPSEVRVSVLSAAEAEALRSMNKTSSQEVQAAMSEAETAEGDPETRMKDLLMTMVKGSNTVSKIFPQDSVANASVEHDKITTNDG